MNNQLIKNKFISIYLFNIIAIIQYHNHYHNSQN